MKVWLVRHAQPLIAPGICYGATNMPAESQATLEAAQALARTLPPGIRVVAVAGRGASGGGLCGAGQRGEQLLLQPIGHCILSVVEPFRHDVETVGDAPGDFAGEVFHPCISEQVEDPAVLDSLGWVLFKQGKVEEALTYFQQAQAKKNAATAAGKNSNRALRNRMAWRWRSQISVLCARVTTLTASAMVLSPAAGRSWCQTRSGRC